MLTSALVVFSLMTSCSNKTFPKETLELFYTIKMTSQHQRELKAKVKIFYSGNEVKAPYEVISLNRYSPWFSIPFFYSYDKQVQKKYLKNAVETAYKQGANGIIVLSPKYYQVIVIDSWDSDQEKAAEQKSIVFDTALSVKFSSGAIYKMKRRNVKRYTEAFNEELKVNARYVTTSAELKFFMYKVDVLDEFYKKSNNTDKKVVAKLEKYRLTAYKRFSDAIGKAIKKAKTVDGLTSAEEMVNTLEGQYKLYPLTKDVIASKIEKHRKSIEEARKKIKN